MDDTTTICPPASASSMLRVARRIHAHTPFTLVPITAS
jgi:hypothetical protein